MEYTQIEKSEIQCDEKGCDWIQSTPWEEVQKWHKKICPKCGKGEIVSDEDLAIWHGMNVLILLDKAVDPSGKLPRVKVKIDTSELRE